MQSKRTRRAALPPVRRSGWFCRPIGREYGRVAAVLAVTTSLLTVGCSTPHSRAKATPVESETLPTLSVEDIMAPPDGGGRSELRRLADQPDVPAVRLRRAYVLIETSGHDRAISELNRVIFGEPPPTRGVESYARYLRSLAYAKKGDRERSRHDLARAAELVQNDDLRRKIQGNDPVPATPRREVAAPGRPLPRSAWDARSALPGEMSRMSRVRRLTVHHSALLAHETSQRNAAAVIHSIQKTHMDGNGWGDIGYHFLIDRAGRVWTGRQLSWQGAHAGGPQRNRGNIGICVLGNFVGSRRGQNPSRAQLAALESLVVDLCGRYGIPSTQILTHRELRSTDCPGARLQLAVDHLRKSRHLTAAVAGTR